MTEKEMEDLLWNHPDKFFDQPMSRVERQSTSRVGRADLIFLRSATFVVVEVKHGSLPREAPSQANDYRGALRLRFPETPVVAMVVANSIPEERKLVCHDLQIECREIPEERFREVAQQVGYTLQSEANPPVVRSPSPGSTDASQHSTTFAEPSLGSPGSSGLGPMNGHFPSSLKAYKPNELVLGAFPPTWLRAKIAVILASKPNMWISKGAIHRIILGTNPTRAGRTPEDYVSRKLVAIDKAGRKAGMFKLEFSGDRVRMTDLAANAYLGLDHRPLSHVAGMAQALAEGAP